VIDNQSKKFFSDHFAKVFLAKKRRMDRKGILNVKKCNYRSKIKKRMFDGEVFYIGKIKAPVSIDCSQGVVFSCVY